MHNIFQDKLDRLKEEKQDIEIRLQYARNDVTIERLEEEIRELDHSMKVVEKWKPK